MLLNLSLLAAHLVLGKLLVALKTVIEIATDVADGDTGLLGKLTAFLHELTTTLLGGRRERQTHHVAIGVGSNPQVRGTNSPSQ